MQFTFISITRKDALLELTRKSIHNNEPKSEIKSIVNLGFPDIISLIVVNNQ